MCGAGQGVGEAEEVGEDLEGVGGGLGGCGGEREGGPEEKGYSLFGDEVVESIGELGLARQAPCRPQQACVADAKA